MADEVYTDPTGLPSLIEKLRQEKRYAFLPDREELEDQASLLSDYFGKPDYATQLQESKELAKMQLGLALAQRGFAAMGAQPGYGESPMGVLGRTLAAPLAGDVSTVAGQLMQQRQAARQAEEQLDRQTKLAALDQLTVRNKEIREYARKLKEGASGLNLGETLYQVKVKGEDGQWNLHPDNIQLRMDEKNAFWVDAKTGNRYDLGTNELAEKHSTTQADSRRGERENFFGMLANLPHIARTEGGALGKTGLKVIPDKIARAAANMSLQPGPDFPFERIDGVPLTESEEGQIAKILESTHGTMYKRIKAGDQKEDIGKQWAREVLSKSLTDFGLPDVTTSEGTSTPPLSRFSITDPEKISKLYVATGNEIKNAPPGADIEKFIRQTPFPVSTRNTRSGIGKVVLADNIGVDFGLSTTNPPNDMSYPERAAIIEGMDRASVQQRLMAEQLSRSTELATSLSPANAPQFDQKEKVFNNALREKMRNYIDGVSEETKYNQSQLLTAALSNLEELDAFISNLQVSGVGGPVVGTVEFVAQKLLDWSPGDVLRSPEATRRKDRVLAALNYTDQIISRKNLVASGEKGRISDKDIEGMQKVHENINLADGFNQKQLAILRGHLVSLVKNLLPYVGSFAPATGDLERAAKMGINTKNIKPFARSGYYSPYLNMGNYAVTGRPIPAFSKEHIKRLQDESIFNYLATTDDVGNVTGYRLVPVKVTQETVRVGDTEVKRRVVEGAGTEKHPFITKDKDIKTWINDPLYKDLVDYNRRLVKKQYHLSIGRD
jgi:hypothetical protein